MKKIFFLSIAVFAVFFYSQNAQAITIVAGPTAQEVQERYGGSIVVIDSNFDKQYWYIEPDGSNRYLVKDGVSVSRLLKKFGQGIHNQDLTKIALDTNSSNLDYNLAHQYKGNFLLQVEEDGQAWYVNPLDLHRYQIANGQKGFEALVNLSLEISEIKLNTIPISENINFQASDMEEGAIDFGMYWNVFDTLKQNYYQPDTVNDKELFYGSLKGLADSLNDPYTTFFTPSGKEDFDDQLEGSVEGIGAMVDIRNGEFEIITPLEGSPAKTAGLQPFDQIWEVDGVNIRDMQLDDAILLIKGETGTDLVLKIYRPSTDKSFEQKITRAKVTIQNVVGETLGNNIAYIKINMFTQNLRREFETVKNQLINENTRGVVIDLRNNPGGYTGSAIALADYWLPENTIIVREQYPKLTYNYSSRLEREINIPTIILVNNGTASAAEIFTSALDENKVAQVVGQATFGKGTGQSLYDFSDGSALKYTIFQWLTSEGKQIEGLGIKPDYELENKANFDSQLQKALDLLK